MGVTHRGFFLFCLTSEYPYESLFRKTLGVALQIWIGGDKTKIKQILGNLIGNAIKFTEQGFVKISFTQDISASRLDTDEFYLQITVEDTGQGIDTSEMQQLFDAFTQTQTGIESCQGTGLGLYIVKKFVELMDGDINVVSEREKGTTFNLKLRLKKIALEPISELQLQDQIKNEVPSHQESVNMTQRILLVDDNVLNRNVLRETIANESLEIKEASSGQEAIDLCIQWQPSLIFMDIRMSPMDGEETAQQIKSLPVGKNTVIIAVTASPSEELRTRLLANNFVAVIEKPFEGQQIFAALNLYLGCAFPIHN
jgi:CheY-like chemotaxis protein/anti-sigma regulatory factor (Ser/Thr protein kinase)